MPRPRKEDRGLSPDSAQILDERFYSAQPWAYFRRRLVHLGLTADPSSEFALPIGASFKVGPVEIRLEPSDAEDDEADVSSITTTRFVAIEAEMLLHHVSETLLRLALAHLPPRSPQPVESPWLAIARERSFSNFKNLVRERFVEREPPATRPDMEALFDLHPEDDEAAANERLDDLARYLSYYASIFLDSDAYNAAKHGLALRGEQSNLKVQIEDRELLDVTGYNLDFLRVVEDSDQRSRWAITKRWFSLEVSIALVWLATSLLENLWSVGRQKRLGAARVRVFTPPSLDTLLRIADGNPRCLVEVKTNLPYDED